MADVQIKKSNKSSELEDLQSMSKEELIRKVLALQAHNLQLKNVISKGSTSEKVNEKNQKKFDFSKCTFRHILLKFFYLGWDYQGYVVQEDTVNTVENYLFEALTRTCLIKDRASSNYHRCGRTDKGVSSFGQVISISIRSKLTPETLNDIENEMDYCKLLNRVLPENIQCLTWCPVEETFSARFDCKSRTYKYFFPKSNLNIEKMKDASLHLLGSHDFRNLCKMDVGNGVVEFIRNIELIEIDLFEKGSQEEITEYSMYVATIKGKAFLWHQIRCIMGVLFLIGAEKEDPSVINELLDINKNPRKPEYSMASEIPLNLFDTQYEIDNGNPWIWDADAIRVVQGRLKSMWTLLNVKVTMIKSMINELTKVVPNVECEENELPCLIRGLKTKVYVPLMKRQKCESLEDKIKHFVKRSRLEIKRKSPEEED